MGPSFPAELAVDSLAGGIAGLSVAPVVSAVDKALAENASGKATLWNSFKGTMLEVAFSRRRTSAHQPLRTYGWSMVQLMLLPMSWTRYAQGRRWILAYLNGRQRPLSTRPRASPKTALLRSYSELPCQLEFRWAPTRRGWGVTSSAWV